MNTVYISHSARRTWDVCHKKYYWNQVLQLTPNKPAYVMDMGRVGHALVDEWVRAGREGGDEIAVKASATFPELVPALKTYYKEWKYKDIEYVRGPEALAAPIAVFGDTKYTYVGETDGLASHGAGFAIVERKFTSRAPSDLVATFQLDDQTRGYGWLYFESLGLETVGTLADIIKTNKYGSPLREFIPFEPDFATNMARFQQDLHAKVEEIHEAREQNRFPMSPHSCFNMGECPYRLLCLNPDREKMALNMGFVKREESHEEGVFNRSNNQQGDEHHE